MASEYLKWKYRNVKPDAPVTYTKKQKAANWWHYHKGWILAGCLLAAALLDIGLNALGIGKTEPDYQLAYVASAPLSDKTLAALETAFSSLGEDLNGDGRSVFSVHSYVDMADSPDNDQPGYAYAANVKLMADLEACESYFFICDDAEKLHLNYDILARADGAIAGLSDPVDAYRWEELSALTSLNIPQEEMTGLFFARRGFWGERLCRHKEACDALWTSLTAAPAGGG